MPMYIGVLLSEAPDPGEEFTGALWIDVMPKEARSVGDAVILESSAESNPALGELKVNTTVLAVLAVGSMEMLAAEMFNRAAIVATICS